MSKFSIGDRVELVLPKVVCSEKWLEMYKAGSRGSVISIDTNTFSEPVMVVRFDDEELNIDASENIWAEEFFEHELVLDYEPTTLPQFVIT